MPVITYYHIITYCNLSMESGCGMWDAEFEKIKDMTREEATVALIEACGKAVVALQESQYAKSEFEKAQSHLQAIRENHSRTAELEEAIAKGNAAMRALCDVDRAAVRLRRFMEALEKHRITDCEGQGASSSN
ncbi:hypothetical protein POM88_020924 [Heracleum sosnowskyi]|uniref:Uncharacterized protein n=1 Tax=Heracleum sosnowskyi TaxID=360622 RepID=A0AAD8IDT7_9APIA|nr:hypothetical protein POM88_020924 [Heracleum sosnowskyi]